MAKMFKICCKQLDSGIVMHLLSSYMLPHEVLLINKYLSKTCVIDVQKLTSTLISKKKYREGGRYLRASVFGRSHSRRERYVLSVLMKKNKSGNKEYGRWSRQMVLGQSAELHACALIFSRKHNTLRQVLNQMARVVLMNELDFYLHRQHNGSGAGTQLALLCDPLPPDQVLSFVNDIENFLPNVCTRYLNLCTKLLLAPDLPVDPDLLFGFEMSTKRSLRMELYYFVLKHFKRITAS